MPRGEIEISKIKLESVCQNHLRHTTVKLYWSVDADLKQKDGIGKKSSVNEIGFSPVNLEVNHNGSSTLLMVTKRRIDHTNKP